MTNTCPLSNNTTAYIKGFRDTLKELTDQMGSAAVTESISASFIRQMIPHHRAAIAMSENLLHYTTNIPLQNIALNIITSQQKSIDQMTGAYMKCQACMNYPREVYFYKRGIDPIISNMLCEMQSACTGNSIDSNFIREMIPHHRGAVKMCEHALRFRLCPQLLPLTEAMAASQKENIGQLQALLPECI